jgi:AAA family ATP:ADP antiporter
MTYSSTVLYFQQAHVVGDSITDRAARTALFARIDFWANVFTILAQVWVAERAMRLLGVGVTLAIVPVVTVLGFVTLGFYPTVTAIVVIQVVYRSFRYGLAKPSREVLFTVVDREEKYKSKAFIDAAVYRGGDLVSGWIYAGLAYVGLTVGAIALVSAPVAAVWAAIGLRLGRRQEERARAQAGAPTAATV